MTSSERQNRLIVSGAWAAAVVGAAMIGLVASQKQNERSLVKVLRLNSASSGRRRREEVDIVDKKRRPNVILMLAEDLGYGDLKSYGHPYARTPNIDSIAEDGTKFLNFHSTGKTCAPARGGLMTGVNPSRMKHYSGDDGFDVNGLSTVTEMFHNAGYRTGHVGKLKEKVQL